jgi:DNA-binding NarL/FixJ family response regulator
MSGSIIMPAPAVAAATDAPITTAVAPTRVLIAAAHELARTGLAAMAAAQGDMTVVAAIGDPRELELRFEQERPDAVLIDFDTPEHREAAAALLRKHPTAVLVALGHHEGDEEIRRALEIGVRGYLPKRLPAKEIFTGVRTALRRKLSLPGALVQTLAERSGEPRLTTREQQVLALVADGRSNACIATALGITTGTVKVHIKAILGKLGAADRTEATVMAFRRGFVRLQ